MSSKIVRHEGQMYYVSMSNHQCVLPQEPKLAFEDVDATELYPCVMFYSSNPGEKVGQLQYPIVLHTNIKLVHCLCLGSEEGKHPCATLFAM